MTVWHLDHVYITACHSELLWLFAGSMNAQAMACNSLQAIAASDRRHAAVFARAGAVPWLVGLVRQSPHHACGGNAAAALQEILQDQGYHVSHLCIIASLFMLCYLYRHSIIGTCSCPADITTSASGIDLLVFCAE